MCRVKNRSVKFEILYHKKDSPGAKRGPFGWPPYKPCIKSPLPETTAISSSSWPGDGLLPGTKRVEEVPAVLCDSLRPRRDSTSLLAVDITMLTETKRANLIPTVIIALVKLIVLQHKLIQLPYIRLTRVCP